LRGDDELQRSNDRFRSLARSLAEMVWVAAPDGQAVDTSGWREYTGQTVEEICGWGWLDAVHAADRNAILAAMHRAAAGGESTAYHVASRIRGADGSYRQFDVRWVPVHGTDGSVQEWIGVCSAAPSEVTNRDRTERELRESEERFRATFEHAAVGIAHVGMDGRWLRVNERLCEIVGYPKDELLKLTFQAITHPDDLDRDLDLAGQLLRGDIDRYSMEKRYRRRDGSWLWAGLTGTIVRGRDGSPDYFIAVVEDISQRKELEDRLVDAEKHLRAVLDSMYAFVGVLSPDGILLEANRAALEAAGLRAEDVLGRRFEEAYWWSYDPDVQRQLSVAIERAARGEPSRYDVVVRLGPDRYEPIDFTISPLRDDSGQVTHLVPSAIVITERVEAERASRKSEAQFRTLADSIPQLAWMADAAGSIFWYNQRWFEYTGASPEDMQGWGWQAVQHPDWVEQVTERFRSAVERGEPWSDTFPIRGADGSYRWFLSRALPITDPDGKVQRWFGTNTDVTEQREAAEERERLYRIVRAASEAKSDFMSTMSHELRTPLNAIIGYADLLDTGVAGVLSDVASVYVDRIRLAAGHQKQLIEDILSFNHLDAQQETAQIQPVSVGDVVREITAVIAPLAEAKGLQLLTSDIEVKQIDTDARKLRQILINLLGNAVKFTASGHVSLRVRDANGTVRFEVEDTGIGLAADLIERAFEPFWQADRSLTRTAEGSGLGLPISRRFAHSLGGDIIVASEPGRGSTFTLVVPRNVAARP
jgi:PAS domain S-box-containing protein